METITISKDILKEYRPEDRFFIVNDNDIDLEPIKIFLPKAPPAHLIDGYGLPAKEQKFHRVTIPDRLKYLEEVVIRDLREINLKDKNAKVTQQKVINEIWARLDANKTDYRREIRWIKKQIYHCHYGYWCYIKGKPTFIDGWHYGYCNFLWMPDVVKNEGYPEYRDRDRRFFHFARYCYTTTEDENGNDVGFRTCLGFMYPKHRRDGATYKCLWILYSIIIDKHGALGGIQSYDDNNAKEHFQSKLIVFWKNLPFFLRPEWRGSSSPQTSLDFKLPQGIAYGDELLSKIDYATTAHRKFYDGKKQHAHLSDENGKTILDNVNERWEVMQHTLAQGDRASIHGLAMLPSTVADMVDQGGQNYADIGDNSKFYERDTVKHQTISGLFRLFIPAWDGLEGYIGPYGESIIDKPTEEQRKFIRKNSGAKEHIESQRDALRKKGDPEAMKKLNEHFQLYPTSWEEAFRIKTGSIGFNKEILDKRIAELKRNPKGVRGYFAWKNGVIDSKVIWENDPEGRFLITKKLNDNESNLKARAWGKDPITGDALQFWVPFRPSVFTASADPFQFSTKSEAALRKDKDKMSDGGGAVFWERNATMDPDDDNIMNWKSYRFVCTYRYRPSTDDEYFEDMLMMCVYFGAMMYPENNLKDLIKHFIKRGYAGYLKYSIDEMTGRLKETPGYYLQGPTRSALFNALRTYIEYRGHTEEHIDFLMECNQIKGVEYLTNFDLLAACGGCMLGSQSEYSKLLEGVGKDKVNIFGAFQQRNY